MLARAPSASTLGQVLRLFKGRAATPAPIRGIYLWGGVGRGKTWLMDLFYDALADTGKLRMHYHQFMQNLHRDLGDMGSRKDPLVHIGADLAARARVLCLDEMQVNDITDAMLMAGLLDTLFCNGVTLVTTSNMPPRELYRGGLQRQRFLPAIDLLEQHCRVLELDSPVDYRLRRLAQAPVYLVPTGAAAEQGLKAHFVRLSGAEHPATASPDAIVINDRAIPALAAAHGVVWIDFDVLCNIPRSKNDYVELARGFHTILLSNLRRLDDEKADRVHRLITLIDALYDRRCKLVCSAEAEAAELYRGRDMAFAFERTASRLAEMQTEPYWSQAHLG